MPHKSYDSAGFGYVEVTLIRLFGGVLRGFLGRVHEEITWAVTSRIARRISEDVTGTVLGKLWGAIAARISVRVPG